MERFEQSNPRIQIEEETEQFVAYDSQGKAVVLQKNAEHPGRPFLSAAAAGSTHSVKEGETQTAEVQLKLPTRFHAARASKGNLRFFSQVKEASAILSQRMALNRG